MDHQEALEALELAAVEPGGLDRLMAGDTPAAAAVAGHLAGCADCADELQRLGRAVPLLRDVLRTTPPPDLRARTLALVRAEGVARGTSPSPAGPADDPTGQGPLPLRASVISRHRAVGLLPWAASIAAAVVISVAAGTAFMGAQLDQRLADRERAIAGLEAVTVATLAVTGQPDVRRVDLAPAGATTASGSLLFSPATTRLVVVASGLTEPPAGKEYRCWVLIDGARQPVGKMFFADDLAYWAGDTPSVANVPSGTTFGVSLTDEGGSGPQADPVIVGQL